MKRPPVSQRPTAVIVLAILNFIFGSLGLASVLCGGLYILFLWFVMSMAPKDPGFQDMLDFYGALFSAVGIPFMIASTILYIILLILLILGGIGLLLLRPWARWLCMGYSIFEILRAIGGTIYSILVINPATIQAMAEFNEKMSRRTKGPPMPMIFSEGMVDVCSILGAVIWMIFPTATLIILLLPRVRAAFTQAPSERVQTQGGGMKDEG